MTSKQNVIAGKPKVGGAIFRAPLGTALPTSAATALPGAYVELGYVSSDGFSRSISKGYESVTAWGGDEVLKSRTDHSVSFSFTLIEDLSGDVHEAKWGSAAVTQTAATAAHGNLVTVSYEGADVEPAVWVLDMEDQGKLHRIVFPHGADTTEGFEQTFSDSQAVGLPFEITAYRDAATDMFFVDYIDDGQTV